MAIKRYAGDKFVGLSTDVKPTSVTDGTTFYEADTGWEYIRHENNWVKLYYDSI